MNTASHSIKLTRKVFLGILMLTLTLASSCSTADSGGATADSNSVPTSKLARALVGTWVHVGVPGRTFQPPATGQRLKHRTGTHWALTNSDPDTGVVREHFGGTYTVDGDVYVETQDYGDATWMRDNGKSWKFRVKVEGDVMTQVGVGNPYTEVWKRVK